MNGNSVASILSDLHEYTFFSLLPTSILHPPIHSIAAFLGPLTWDDMERPTRKGPLENYSQAMMSRP